MIDWVLVYNVILTIVVCWNVIDIHNFKKKQKVIEKIQEGDDDYEAEPARKEKQF